MKIVRLDSDNEAFLMADSAWRPDRRPYFVPEGEAPVCEIRPALRIDRLGKAINPKFASRYIGAWTPVCYMRPSGSQSGLAPAGMLDDSLVVGTWMPLPHGEVPLALGDITASWGLDTGAASQLIARLSASSTFKIGDIVVLPRTIFSFTPVAGSSVRLTAAGNPVLEFNIR